MLHQLDNLIPWVRNARLRFSQDTDFEGHLAFAILSTLEIFCEESSAIKDANPMERLEHLWVFVNQHSLQAPMGIWFILLGSMAHMRNIDPDVGRQVEKAVERIRSEGQQWVLGMSLVIQSWLYGEYTINEGLLLEASSIFEAMGVHFERGMVAEMLGRHAYQQKRPHAVVTDHFLRAKQAFEQLGICYYAQVDWLFLSGMYFQQGKPEEGFIIHKEVQRAQKELGNTRQLSLSLQWEGLHAGRYSTREHTLSLLERCLDMTRKHGSQSDLNWRLFELGEAYRIFGDKEKALELILEAETGFKKLNMIQGLGYCQRAYGDIALDEHCYDEAFSFFIKYKDLATRDNHAWSMAQADSKIALAKAYLDKLEDSREMIRETLVRIQDWGEIDLILLTLLAEPVCLFQEGRFKRSVQIAAFIANHPVSWNETRKRAQTILKIASQDLPTQDIEESIELAKTFDIHSVTKDIIES